MGTLYPVNKYFPPGGECPYFRGGSISIFTGKRVYVIYASKTSHCLAGLLACRFIMLTVAANPTTIINLGQGFGCTQLPMWSSVSVTTGVWYGHLVENSRKPWAEKTC